MANFYHVSMYSPVLTTLQNAIRNSHLVTWPGTSKINFIKYITDILAIDKGHLDQERKKLQSTKTTQDLEDILPTTNVQTKTTRTAIPSMPTIWPKITDTPTRDNVCKNSIHNVNHIFNEQGMKMNIDTLLAGPETRKVWMPATENELGRLSQGFKQRVKVQDAINFIYYKDVPKDRKVTYANFICDYHPLKSEKFRVRLTLGGDKLDYPDATTSPTTSLLETKLLINSVISDHKLHNAKLCLMDLKDFFLWTPMERLEYIHIHSKYFSKDFIKEYEL